jgi:hypothetical protein
MVFLAFWRKGMTVGFPALIRRTATPVHINLNGVCITVVSGVPEFTA